MKAVAVLLLAMVATSHAGHVLLRAAPNLPLAYAATPLGYAAAPLGYAAAPLGYAAAPHAPVVYSTPKLTNVEVETPVITKTNLHVLTDSDEISTTEIKPYGVLGTLANTVNRYNYAGYPNFVY